MIGHVDTVTHMKRHSPLPMEYAGCGWSASGLSDLSVGSSDEVPDRNKNFWKMPFKEAVEVMNTFPKFTADSPYYTGVPQKFRSVLVDFA